MEKTAERTVWSRVKEALNDAGIPDTQVYAAKLIGGKKQGSISDWNKPNRGMRLEHARIIGKKTNTCVEWLLTGEGPKHPGPPEERIANDLWSLWGRLPEDRKGELLGLAKAYAITGKRRDDGETRELQRRPS